MCDNRRALVVDDVSKVSTLLFLIQKMFNNLCLISSFERASDFPITDLRREEDRRNLRREEDRRNLRREEDRRNLRREDDRRSRTFLPIIELGAESVNGGLVCVYAY
ncbi:hypothetical protein L1987_80909 [Smallanthus sonchifolius]|uniref:Uncharacterized protein n=1 Tax=Smallanthus sonchifolius TaxID=185202 RepID=A0ACB8YNZ8_9ASTR|nr:hypothetical protein L1987_80909 [Smallanthus sonchifolius]